ncbi:hypothetical protein BC936DRAFT_140306 [Jimgerdemannia flammicorona]|uniref:Uncharacterized protein n=1 Tax=Jimgerdemannia flammicorona TaxID=994334 RepID=A0A433AVA4_9FUNG|nr:hypothetical protein BC936DRAFT_140306 [Jimgerdemannia flammicorona]
MNSTTAAASPPLIAHPFATTFVAWSSVAFGIISLGVIGHKAFVDFSKLRLGCLAMGALIMCVDILNTLRIGSLISETNWATIRATLTILFVDLMMAITLNVGQRFYIKGEHVNSLYKISIAATVMTNVMTVISIILQNLLAVIKLGSVFDGISRLMWPVTVAFAYWYAFHPVINMKSGIEKRPSAVVAIGVW